VVFGGFGAREPAARIDDARPEVIVATSCGVDAGRVVRTSRCGTRRSPSPPHRPSRCVVVQRPQQPFELVQGRDLSWDEALDGAEPAGCGDPLKGQVPRGFVVLKAGSSPSGVEAEPVALVRTQIGAVVSLRRVDVVTALPRTRSGKILRRTMRAIADGRDEAVPSTIDDPAVLDALRPVLRS
jgi:acyl-coenzyme A synthetase/AMP-(fatty) acid ligase